MVITRPSYGSGRQSRATLSQPGVEKKRPVGFGRKRETSAGTRHGVILIDELAKSHQSLQ